MRLLTVSSSAVLVALCTLLAGGCGGTTDSDNLSDPSSQDGNLGAGQGAPGQGAPATADGGTSEGGGVYKVTICHIPPGNHANAHTITVGAPAVAAHLRHGDTMGACGGVSEPDAGSDNGGGEDDGGVSEPDAGSGGDIDAGPACIPQGDSCNADAPDTCCSGTSCTDGYCVPLIG